MNNKVSPVKQIVLTGLALLLLLARTSYSVAEEYSSLENKTHRFVASLFNNIQEKSFKDNREYCGLIFYNKQGVLEASTANKGGIDSCIPDDVSEEYEVIASYHTHGSATLDADTEVPSIDDLEADIEEGINGYIATPAGRLWFNDVKSKKAILLCGRGCLKSDPRFVECTALFPDKEYTLDKLIEREENDNGEC
jgi:uncharacterized protein DUF4329